MNLFTILIVLIGSAARGWGYYEFGQLSTCKVTLYTYLAERTDGYGRGCFDALTVRACQGKCESLEFADWRFPHKRSVHSVCVHGAKQLIRTRLRYCDDGVDEELRNYEYYSAISCACQLCDSSETSCEGF